MDGEPELDLAALAADIVSITKEPMQTIARVVQEIAVKCNDSEVWWRRKRDAATSPEDIMVAATGESHARGARVMAEAIADAIQRQL